MQTSKNSHMQTSKNAHMQFSKKSNFIKLEKSDGDKKLTPSEPENIESEDFLTDEPEFELLPDDDLS